MMGWMGFRGPMGPVRMLVVLAAFFLGLAGWLAVGGRAEAATIRVNPGQTIQSGVNAAAAGDTVLVSAGTYTAGVTLNKAVTLQAEVLPDGRSAVTVNGNNSGQAVLIQCSDCAVIGFTFVDFAYGIGADTITGRNRVTLRNNIQRNTNYGFWISGDDWLVENNEVDRIIRRSSGGDADYGRIFGNRHVVRRNWFHGTQIPTDLAPGPDYAHTDGLQYYNQNGEILRDALIEENIFSEFVQGLFIGNETGNGTAVQRVTVRNNVFWGTSFPATGNLLGSPSWGVYFGKNGPERQIVVENNIFRNCSNALGILTGTDAIVRGNIVANGGTVMILEGTAPSLVTLTPGGNLLYQNNWGGEMNIAGGVASVNPQFQNASATNRQVVGADGIPWTTDDAWRPMNAAAQSFGPQVALGGTDPAPTPTDGTYRVTVTTTQGQTGQTTVAVRRRPRPETVLVVVGAQSRDVVAGQSVTVTYASLVTSGPAYTGAVAIVGTAPAGWSVSATSAGFTVSVPSTGAAQSAVYRATITTPGGQSKTVDVTVRGREVALVMNTSPALVEVEEGSSVLVPWSAIVVSGPGGYTGAVAGVTLILGVTATSGSQGVTFTAN